MATILTYTIIHIQHVHSAWKLLRLPTNSRQRALYLRVFHPKVCLSIRLLSLNTYFVCCNVSILGGGILKKFGKNIQRVNGHCSTGFQGQRSKVKVIARPNALFWQRDSHQLMTVRPLCIQQRCTDGWCGIQDHLLLLHCLSKNAKPLLSC